MANIAFDFSAATEPALALRIANLVTQDIERLEASVFGTRTNWQRLDKPFKAHYAIRLVNQISSPEQRAFILEALPSYEKNAANYKRDSKRRGRPLTEYTHKKSEGNNMPRIEMTNNLQDNEVPATPSDESLDDQLRELLEATGDNMEAKLRERIEANAQSRPSKPQGESDTPANAQAQASAGEDDPLRAAVQQMLDVMQVQRGEGDSNLDEDRVREIAREEDKANVPVIIETLQDYIREQVKPVTTVTVERVNGAEREVVEMGLQHKSFVQLLKLLQVKNADGYQYPVWLPGPAGSGKTTAARNAAKALNLPFYFTGAVDNQYQLLGFRDAGGNYGRTTFREAWEHGGVYLWDEVDASNPNALTVFNAAFENGVCAFPDGIVARHPDCILIAAANTYGHGATHEYVGRNKLDAATVDRFIMLDWTYDEDLERNLSSNKEWCTWVQKARRACAAAGVKHVISPRASIRGSELLASGFARDFVERSLVRKGLPDDSWRTITSRM
jgi:hypothetical protein